MPHTLSLLILVSLAQDYGAIALLCGLAIKEELEGDRILDSVDYCSLVVISIGWLFIMPCALILFSLQRGWNHIAHYQERKQHKDQLKRQQHADKYL